MRHNNICGADPDDASYKHWQQRYKALSREDRILYCIDQLQNEAAIDTSFSLSETLPEGVFTNDPASCPRYELIKIGKDAIPHLIAALDRKEETEIHTSRYGLDPWRVQDAALDVIQRITCHEFSDAIRRGGLEKSFLAALSTNEMSALRSTIMDWWASNKDGDEIRWAEAALMSIEKENWFYRMWAVSLLYERIGTNSSPILVRAYDCLPKECGSKDDEKNVTDQKVKILGLIQKDPSPKLREFLLRCMHDNPFAVRLVAAQCLWAIKDKAGLDAILQETKEKILPAASADEWIQYPYAPILIEFFSACGTPESRQMIVACLDAKSEGLREAAVYAVLDLKCEVAFRKLPELFDDLLVLGEAYNPSVGNKGITSPLIRVCDAAAEAFSKAAPEAPRHSQKTAAEQAQTLEAIKQWWQKHQAELVWDPAQGILKLKK